MEDRAFWMFVWVMITIMFTVLIGGAFANNSYTDYKVGELIKLGYDPIKVRCAFVVPPSYNATCVILSSQNKE